MAMFHNKINKYEEIDLTNFNSSLPEIVGNENLSFSFPVKTFNRGFQDNNQKKYQIFDSETAITFKFSPDKELFFGDLESAVPLTESSTELVIETKNNQNYESFLSNSNDDFLGLTSRLIYLFTWANSEEFEDGIESTFTHKLKNEIEQVGNNVIAAISDLILYGRINIEVGSEALKLMGRISDLSTYSSRKWILERSLFCRFDRIRDSACLGLASLNDIRSKQYLEIAYLREENTDLRSDIKQVIDSLGN